MGNTAILEKLSDGTSQTIQALAEDVRIMHDEYLATGTEPWTAGAAAMDLAYQVGSLSKLVMQMENFRMCRDVKRHEIKDMLSDEIVDVIADALFLANHLEVDLDEAWRNMRRSDRRKISGSLHALNTPKCSDS